MHGGFCIKKKYLFLFCLFVANCLYSNELLIRHITFEGNISFTAHQLQHIILSKEQSPLHRGVVNDDSKRIYDFYTQRGHYLFKIYNPIIIPVSSRYVDVTFVIEELEEPSVEGITFTGNSYFSESKIFELINLKPDAKHDLTSLETTLKQVTDLYLSRGFLFVKVQLINIAHSKKDNFLDGADSHGPLTATINIKEGRLFRTENFVLKGNDVTRDNILIAESRIQKGHIVTPDIIRLAERRISNKLYIASCNILPVNENTLLLNIVEGRMTHLSAVLGFSTSEQKRNNFNGFINGEFLNLLGTDRNLKLTWRSFDAVFTSILFEYHESGPIHFPIAADFRLYREERDSTSVRTEVGTEMYYYYKTQKYGILGGINELFPGSRRPKLLEKQTDKIIGLFWEGDFTDDFINPSTGWHMKFSQQYLFVSKESERLHRHRLESSFAYYFPLSKSWVVANTVTGKYLENKSLTEFDLIRLGGAFSLRGFYEDFYAGNTILYTNTELRLLMTRYSRIFLFFDYGYLEDNRPEFMNKFYDLYGIGFGLRADSKIGLLRIDYGFHHANGKWLNPLNGIIHFGIEASF